MGHLRLEKKLSRIQRDPQQNAKAVGLRYTSDQAPGWLRIKKGEKCWYVDDDGKKCVDKAVLQRIKKLAIPPAWEKVWISKDEQGHLQATGVDAKGRKQYRYHVSWNNIRNQTKYFRLPQFAEALPLIRLQLDKDLKLPGFPYRKVLALAVRILEQTNIRIGNEAYKNLYGSFGLTTLQNRHVQVEGAQVKFQFKGKKGIRHTLILKGRKLAALIQQCREIPGKELFQYSDDQDRWHSIGSGDVNQYIKEISGMDFTAKDFRTWAGTVTAFRSLRDLGEFETAAQAKSNILRAIDAVAENLGNTRAVCRKYYIHPAMLETYEKGTFFKKLPGPGTVSEEPEGLSEDEKLVRQMLLEHTWE